MEQQHDQTNKMIKCAQQRLQSGLASDKSEWEWFIYNFEPIWVQGTP